MNELPRPDHDTSPAELTALDLALDQLSDPGRSHTDPALAALAGFAQAIDARAAALTTQPRPGQATATPNRRTPATPKRHTTHPPGRPRPRLRRRLLALPLTLALAALLVTGPLSASPGTPLYPLHQLIFDDRSPSPADNARLSLASAGQALDHAATSTGPTRTANLREARRQLTEARRHLAQISDTHILNELEAELHRLEQRADQLDNPQQQQDDQNTGQQTGDSGTGGNPGSNGNHDKNQNGIHGTTEPPDSGSHDQGNPTAVQGWRGSDPRPPLVEHDWMSSM